MGALRTPVPRIPSRPDAEVDEGALELSEVPAAVVCATCGLPDCNCEIDRPSAFSGVVAIVYALLLVPNAILARIFLGQLMGRQLLIGSAVAMAGVALLFLHEARLSDAGPEQALIGIGIALLGVLSASVANVMQAMKTAKAYPMATTLGWAMRSRIASCVVVMPRASRIALIQPRGGRANASTFLSGFSRLSRFFRADARPCARI